MMRNLVRNAVVCAAAAMLSAPVYAQEEKSPLDAYNITGFQTLIDLYEIPNGFNPPCPVIKKPPYRPHSGKPTESSVGSNVDAWNEWTPENVPAYCREEAAAILTPPDGRAPQTRFKIRQYWDPGWYGHDDNYSKPVPAPIGLHFSIVQLGASRFFLGSGGVSLTFNPVVNRQGDDAYQTSLRLTIFSATMRLGHLELIGKDVYFGLSATKEVGDMPKNFTRNGDQQFSNVFAGISFELGR
jgi:hypothetical protein